MKLTSVNSHKTVMVEAIVPLPHHCLHSCTKATFVFICFPAMQQWSDCSHSHKRFTQISLSTRYSLHPSLRLQTRASILTFKLASSNSFDFCCCLRERELLSSRVSSPMWRSRRKDGWKEKRHPQQCSTGGGRERDEGLEVMILQGWGQRDTLQAIKLVFLSLVL